MFIYWSAAGPVPLVYTGVMSGKVTILAIFIWAATPAVAKAASSCFAQILIADHFPDFAIETIYPNVKVEVGVINRGSKAFQLWRQKTPPFIPDAAFNAHYYTEEQKLIAAKYGISRPVDRVVEADLGLTAAARRHVTEFYRSGSKAYEYKFGWELTGEPLPSTRAAWRYGSVQAFLERMKIDPRLTSERLRQIRAGEFDGRYFVLADGRTLVVSQEETQAMNAALRTELYHAGLTDLFFADVPSKKVDLIDMGYIIRGKQPNSFNIYTNSYDFRKERSFNAQQFLIDMGE